MTLWDDRPEKRTEGNVRLPLRVLTSRATRPGSGSRVLETPRCFEGLPSMCGSRRLSKPRAP